MEGAGGPSVELLDDDEATRTLTFIVNDEHEVVVTYPALESGGVWVSATHALCMPHGRACTHARLRVACHAAYTVSLV